jgi:hypothetical protein
MILDGKCPTGPIETSWDRHRFESKLVNPANKRKYKVLCVGTGLAGGAAAASLGELGYQVEAFCYQDSARRAHSIAAQGGINAAKNYPNDGDSVYRLFYDTIKGGDFRAREADVWRLAQVSNNIIDQCVATTLSTSVLPRASLSLATTPVISITVLSVAHRSPVLFMLAAKPDSNCCSALIRRSLARLKLVRLSSLNAGKCLTWLSSTA